MTKAIVDCAAVADELEALRDLGVLVVPCPQCEAAVGKRCRWDWNTDLEMTSPHRRRAMMYLARKRRLTSYLLPALVDSLWCRFRLRPHTSRKLDRSIRRWAWAEAITLIAADLTDTHRPITPVEHRELLLLAEVSDVDPRLLHAIVVERPLGEPGC